MTGDEEGDVATARNGMTTPGSSPTAAVSRQPTWAPVVIASVLLILVPTLALLLLMAFDVNVPLEVGLAGLVAVAIGFFLVLLVALSGAYDSAGASGRDAFGLPEGSVRALIAMAVLVA